MVVRRLERVGYLPGNRARVVDRQRASLQPGATVAVMIYDQLTDQRVIATISPDSVP